jgi:polyphosphate kinase
MKTPFQPHAMSHDRRHDGPLLNYEISWLQFNWRVLHEAQRLDNPLLERVRFVSIVCSNLDEFFQKRVGGLKRQLHAGVTHLSPDGRTPSEQLSMIREEVLRMIAAYRDLYFNDLIPGMRNQGIHIRSFRDLDERQRQAATRYFEERLYPIITPLAVDEGHPFPFISNKSRSMAIRLRDPDSGEERFARIKIPSNRPRWMVADERLENQTGTRELILCPTSDIIKEHINRFFPGMEVLAAHVFRVTRNADLERNEEEAEDLLELIEGELKERRFSEIVRMEIDIDTPSDIRAFLKQELGVKEEDIYDMRGPIGLVDVHELANLQGFDALRHPLWTPALHPILRPRPDEPAPDLFEAIRKGFIVHHPYHSFESTTQRFVELAAADPDVLAIKQTLYRTSSDSPLMHALIRAADTGKQVAVLVELKARFDEQQNITWAQKLEKAGVHVSYGIAGLKIHCKLTMVVKEEQEGLRRYVHIGTGNYHPKTAQLYEDFGLFTCDEAIAADVTDLFNMLTGYARTQTYRRLMVAPTHMRREMERLILREMDHARKGRKAGIIAKMNALEDPGIIRLLYEASQEGVEIDLIVRGVCRLVPGIPGLSERIRVRSVIGRFLEHSRCYVFENGGDPDYFIGSADWMHRNLDARVEALAPVTDDALKAYLSFCLDTYLSDNRQSWVLGPDALYTHLQPSPDEPPRSCHAVFMQAASQRL